MNFMTIIYYLYLSKWKGFRDNYTLNNKKILQIFNMDFLLSAVNYFYKTPS